MEIINSILVSLIVSALISYFAIRLHLSIIKQDYTRRKEEDIKELHLFLNEVQKIVIETIEKKKES